MEVEGNKSKEKILHDALPCKIVMEEKGSPVTRILEELVLVRIISCVPILSSQ